MKDFSRNRFTPWIVMPSSFTLDHSRSARVQDSPSEAVDPASLKGSTLALAAGLSIKRMREAAHEKGRRQLMGFMRFLTGLPGNADIAEIGNAYDTSAAAVVEATDPRGPVVHYDGVARINRESGMKVTCYVESKYCGTASTVLKLKRHVEEFVANAFCVLVSWSDDMSDHFPNFIFVSNAYVDSPLVDEFGRLTERYTQALLKKEGLEGPAWRVDQLRDAFVYVHYSNWIQEVMS